MLFIAIEYLLVHAIFETIRENDIKRAEINNINWKPLSKDYIDIIKKLTS